MDYHLPYTVEPHSSFFKKKWRYSVKTDMDTAHSNCYL